MRNRLGLVRKIERINNNVKYDTQNENELSEIRYTKNTSYAQDFILLRKWYKILFEKSAKKINTSKTNIPNPAHVDSDLC